MGRVKRKHVQVKGICGQQRPRSACASVQSDQGLHGPLTELFDSVERIKWQLKSYNITNVLNDLNIITKMGFRLIRSKYNYIILYVPPHQKTHPWTLAPCEDSDQPAHSHRLIRIFTGVFGIAKDSKFLHADNEDSNQTARMRRLIWICVGCTCLKVRFHMLRFKYWCHFIDCSLHVNMT